jgi:hypothetical protein
MPATVRFCLPVLANSTGITLPERHPWSVAVFLNTNTWLGASFVKLPDEMPTLVVAGSAAVFAPVTVCAFPFRPNSPVRNSTTPLKWPSARSRAATSWLNGWNCEFDTM